MLRALAIVDLAATGLYMPMESVLFPKYFTDRNEPAQLGWVLMALSVGGLIGALGYAVLSKYMSRRTTMLTAVITLGVAMTVIAFLPPLPLILVLCAVVGLVYGPIAPIYNYVMQTRAPKHLRGRVVGVMGSLAYAAGPLGLDRCGPTRRRGRPACDLLGAGAADAASRRRRDLPACAAGSGSPAARRSRQAERT